MGAKWIVRWNKTGRLLNRTAKIKQINLSLSLMNALLIKHEHWTSVLEISTVFFFTKVPKETADIAGTRRVSTIWSDLIYRYQLKYVFCGCDNNTVVLPCRS